MESMVLKMRKMKDSGIEWIGEIPEGWEITRLKYLADFEPTCDTSYLTDESKITYTPMECVKNGGFENRSALYGNLSHTLTPFQNGDIAMAKVTPCFENGNIAIMDNLFSGFGLGSSELFIFRPKSISTRYFFYWLQNKAFVARACSTMTGTGGLKRISPSFIRNCPVHCPSTDEQTMISDYLDAKCSEIDDLLTSVRSSIEEYKKLKQAVITQAVTKGVRGEREMKDSGVEWIGEIPKEWGRTKIKMIASFFNGDRTSRYPQPSDFVDAGVAFLTSRNIDSDEVDLSETKYITDDKYKSLSGAKIQIDDIIFCLRGSVGKCAINRTLSRGTVASSLATIRSKDIYPKYLLYFLLSNIASTQTTIFMNGTCAANLSAENVGNYYITLPISAEQKEIADYLDAKCAEIDKLIAKKEQLVKELESYKKSLIYEVVTGKREV